jgi:hypothetical protein
MVRFDSNAFLRILESDALHDWIIRLVDVGVFDERRGERTVQAYIMSHIFHHCFFSVDSVYQFRPIKIEYRPSPANGEPIPDIIMMSSTHREVVDVWIEIKEYIGQGELSARQLTELEWDFRKTNQVHRGHENSIGVVLIIGDDKISLLNSVRPLMEIYPNAKVVIIAGSDPYAG